MPSYTYRCKTCQMVHTVSHDASEMVRACFVCGGFTERIIEKAPRIVHSKTEQPKPPASSAESCPSGCVLHQHS